MSEIWIDPHFHLVNLGLGLYQIRNSHGNYIGNIEVSKDESPIEKAKEYLLHKA